MPLFTKIAELCQFNPRTAMLDMEQAVASTLIYKFPQVDLSLCWFHYKQSNLAWIRENGMIIKYSEHNNILFRKFINQIVALCFVPVSDVVFGFEVIPSQTLQNQQ